MRFQITIRQQAQAINGKAKYPLYKPRGERNFDQQYGLQTLQQLVENNSIKIFCTQCLKQITQQTVVIGYEDGDDVRNDNNGQNNNNIMQNEQVIKNDVINPINKQQQTINKQQQQHLNNKDNKNEELFQEKQQSEQNNNDKSNNEQMKDIHKQQVQNIKMEEEKKQQQKMQMLLSQTITTNINKQTQKGQKQPQQQSKLPQPQHHPTILYCIGCFASLQQFPTYYSLRKSLKLSPQNTKWRIIDQICLLNGLKIWGFGNWGQIKQFMDYNACPFTVKEIQTHYEQVYLHGEGPFVERVNNNNSKNNNSSIQILQYSSFHEPKKRLIEQIMHNYYYPPQSEKRLGQYNNGNGNSRQSLENNINNVNSMKRERPVGFDNFDQQQQEEEKVQLNLMKSTSHKGLQGNKSVGRSSSQAVKGVLNVNNNNSNNNNNNNTNDNLINLPSHTSLMNQLQKQGDISGKRYSQQYQLNPHKHKDKSDGQQQEQEDNSQQEQQQLQWKQQRQQQELIEEEEQQQQDVMQNEIQLKPKSSHILLSSSKKNIVNSNSNGTGGKFINISNNNSNKDIKPQSTEKINDKIINSNNNNNLINNHHINNQLNNAQPTHYPIHLKFSNLKGHNVYSYNPKRKQFQIIQYDYYAQSMIAQLQFSQDDTQEQQLLKIKIIQEYNRRLDERIKRREFVIQHRLLDTDFMIKTLQKYNKHNVQRFQPFRRLIDKNEQYFQIVQTYDTLCKTRALTQGLMKVKRKLKQKIKSPKFKDVLEYLNVKKEKKELLGQRGKFDKQKERRVLVRQRQREGNTSNISNANMKGSKKIIMSMLENNSNYANVQNNIGGGQSILLSSTSNNNNNNNNINVANQSLPQQQPLHQQSIHITSTTSSSTTPNRRMTSRSQQRQRLRSHQMTNTNKQGENHQQFAQTNNNSNNNNIKMNASSSNTEQIMNLSSKQMKINTQLLPQINNTSSSIYSILSEEDVKAIEKMMERQVELETSNNNNKDAITTNDKNNNNNNNKPIVLKNNYIARPLLKYPIKLFK